MRVTLVTNAKITNDQEDKPAYPIGKPFKTYGINTANPLLLNHVFFVT
ncbi:hypothetical protein [Cecembia rubra]|uniref:Uncharacterized protein n=1 Tax=Cecembia rubra TaxID=1485585 RepID=A0A2P8E8H6_9BACT|nr:hypothetical protein [Cecembia rubra]PSL05782.1 hypothetical protein CLV48_103297 [Cecembia rubra]